MSLLHSLSNISPISYNRRNSGFPGSSSTSHMQRSPTFLLLPVSPCIQCRCQNLAGVVAGSCLRTPYNFIRDFVAAKAVKTDNAEVPLSVEEENTIDFDWGEEEDEGSPWEGAIVYRRNPSISHMEYCTTLERLGLLKLSSQISRSRASAMGLRVTKAVKDYLDGTPVLISVDITRKKHKLRLDGIIRTVLTLSCNRCGEPASESVFSNFSLLLTDEPVEEPEIINIGTMYGQDKSKSSSGNAEQEEDEDDASIDLEDRLHFPQEAKEIDISKQIRDLVHLEITINTVCDSKCKGLCLQCGTNLNTSTCSCSEQEMNDLGYGPLGDLKTQMQRK